MKASEELAALTSAVSTNLRELAAEFGSISRLCREGGINRQQLNKYLSGENLPSLPVLAKLCAALGVGLDRVVSAGGGLQPEEMPIEQLLRAVECNRDSVEPGYYLEITRAEAVEDSYLIAISDISDDGGARRYRRRNKVTCMLRSETIWNYAGFVHTGRDCAMITYANIYEGEEYVSDMFMNYGSYFLRRANHFSADLIGMKAAVSAEEPGMPFAAPVYFRYLGEEIDHDLVWARCRTTPRHELDDDILEVLDALRARVRRVPVDEVIKIGL
ncbi:MAG: helix-turn-helix domain-containing protein [Pikeienuella sp.]